MMGKVWENGGETSILWMWASGSVILIDKRRNSSKYPASLQHSDTYMNKYSCKWRLICNYLSLEANDAIYRGMRVVLCVCVCVCLCVCSLSGTWLFTTPWTVARQAPLSLGFPRQEYWSGLPFPSPGDLPNSGIKPSSPGLAGRFSTTEPPGRPKKVILLI